MINEKTVAIKNGLSVSEDDLNDVIWPETGYPYLREGDPEDSIRLSLARARARELRCQFGYFDAETRMIRFEGVL